MGYEASLTALVQQNMDTLTEKLIAEGNDGFDHLTSEKIFDFLTDMTYCNTFGFILRRYVQVTFPEFFEGFEKETDYADLTQNRNVPWPDDLLAQLGQKLSHAVYQGSGVTIQKGIWIGYLSDRGRGITREKIFQVAFVLHMDEETTSALLLSRSVHTYMMRNPRDFIYYYCQKRREQYTWKDVQALWERYQSEVADQYGNQVCETGKHGNGQEGWTVLARGQDMEQLIQSTLPVKEAEDELIAYMAENHQEFLPVHQIGRISGSRSINGYSLTAYTNLARLMEYLNVLYPTYQKREGLETKRDGEAKHDQEELVVQEVNGVRVFDIKKQVTAMLQKRGLQVSSEMKVDPQYAMFETEVIQYLKKYMTHINQIEKIHSKEEAVAPIERNDILLMSYFFVAEYWVLYHGDLEDETVDAKIQMLQQMSEEGSVIDHCMKSILEWTEEADYNCDDMEEMGNFFRRCINGLLDVFGFSPFYVPNLFDRFILILLYLLTSGDEIDGAEDIEDVIKDIFRVERGQLVEAEQAKLKKYEKRSE